MPLMRAALAIESRHVSIQRASLEVHPAQVIITNEDHGFEYYVNDIRHAHSIDMLCWPDYGAFMASARSRRKRSRRKQPVQQSLFRRGGKRRGAGRKPTGARARERHGARPFFKESHPLHVVLRVVPEIGSLRCRKMYKAIRGATITAALREWFRIVHVSIQRTHVHMLVEAEHKVALGHGMQGFEIAAARNINTALGDGVHRRRGKVFADRYHVEVITSPTRARRALAYVLLNWRHHNEDQHGLAATWLVDPFSTGAIFGGWKELEDQPWMWPLRETYDPLVVFRPASWLLREGYLRGGGPISAREVPGPRD